ncbi:Interferon-related developmental regulator 1 [Trichinella pseudospiralis]|uniref:Interferon-related developmental regulator 1 n=2 Tax=Trichinella pseudospiralis TaxID=6337 RepID=A0A0V1IFU0_TRIPS|nr:Interferon-related developmental regulator 1 [Trichinella pseudospiralis]KRY85324.1 Interferon-related developmental regulator 1 [Trichinella pseudospiralis]KRZ21396.1 Interferon-related developmental regulator 1 [Trichinella pseudospiralis]KRZ36043.1 Interferon-related developmental regulator 1 [Trichinella pseudospiralis]
MPRKRHGGNKSKARIIAVQDDNDDDRASCTASEISQISVDDISVEEENGNVVGDVESLEEKLKECIDNMSGKSSAARLASLKSIHHCFSRHYLPAILENWKVTFADNLDRSIRKCTQNELELCIHLATLLALQLGTDSCSLLSKMMSVMRNNLTDNNKLPKLRCLCATSLALCTFAAVEELEDISDVIQTLGNVWTQAKPVSTCATSVPVFCAAVSSWAILLTQLPAPHLKDTLKNYLPRLSAYLESSSVDVRVATGETLALIYELARNVYGSAFYAENHQYVLSVMQEMSVASEKCQTKRDRRVQRSSFRDIYAALKDGFAPCFKVKFGNETLVIDSWCWKLFYEMFCSVFASGMNTQLKENQFVREVFQLGLPSEDGQLCKLSKLEKKVFNQRMSKARKIYLAQLRDKRIAEPYSLENANS